MIRRDARRPSPTPMAGRATQHMMTRRARWQAPPTRRAYLKLRGGCLGRTIEETDPNGNITYTVYNDAEREIRVYPGSAREARTCEVIPPSRKAAEGLP
jgi:hypothetical protein